MEQTKKVRIKVGDELLEGHIDSEKGIFTAMDGRKFNVKTPQKPPAQEPQNGAPQPTAPTPAPTPTPAPAPAPQTSAPAEPSTPPGIRQPMTAQERQEEIKRRMAEKEAEKARAKASKGQKNSVSENKKASVNRTKQEKIEELNRKKIEAANKKRMEKEEKLAKKIAQRESKTTKRVVGDADSFDPKEQNKKKITIAITYVVVILLLLVGAKILLVLQQDEVTVVRLKADMLAGEVITEGHIEPYKMLKKSYDELGTVNYSANGLTAPKQIIYQWEDKEEVIDKYIANYTQGGQYLTLKNVTDKKVIRNPWLAEVQAGDEIYTLPFKADGLNPRLLLPGTHLRARVVVQSRTGGGGGNPVVDGNPIAGNGGGVNTLDKAALVGAGGTVPNATVVFDDLVAVDMLNGNGESLFDIYMALSKLSVEDRVRYLETTIEGNSTNFQQRVLPASLVFILSKEQATRMAEFENLSDAKIKYTILPFEDEDGNLLSSFTEIADQMNDIFDTSEMTKESSNSSGNE